MEQTNAVRFNASTLFSYFLTVVVEAGAGLLSLLAGLASEAGADSFFAASLYFWLR
jgi:hypothetical protein